MSVGAIVALAQIALTKGLWVATITLGFIAGLVLFCAIIAWDAKHF